MTDETNTCMRCRFWNPYTTLLSVDGLEFQIGHCETYIEIQPNVLQTQLLGLTADNYGCARYQPYVVDDLKDDADTPPVGEEA